MRIHRLGLAALPALAALLLAGCGGSDQPKAPPGEGSGGAKQEEAAAPPEKKMPEYQKSGVVDDYKQFKKLSDDARHAKKEEKEAAEKALADFLASVPEKWAGKVPEPEAIYFAMLLGEAGKHAEAAEQDLRYLSVAPQSSPNFVHATTHLIKSHCEVGDYRKAEDALAKACGKDGIYASRMGDRIGAQTTIAIMQMNAGKFEDAVKHFEQLMTLGTGDPESALYGVDCLLRAGKRDAALAFARKAVAAFPAGESHERMKVLVQAVELIGQPAPGFEGVVAWKAAGDPGSLEGNVTVVFTWNMQGRWVPAFFKRLNDLYKDYEEKNFQMVGISRLAKYDPVQGGTVKELTDEKELEFYDMWANQYAVRYSLAVCGYEDESLRDAWSGQYAPSLVVVGKDGKIFYHRTGNREEHFLALKEMIDKAFAQ